MKFLLFVLLAASPIQAGWTLGDEEVYLGWALPYAVLGEAGFGALSLESTQVGWTGGVNAGLYGLMAATFLLGSAVEIKDWFNPDITLAHKAGGTLLAFGGLAAYSFAAYQAPGWAQKATPVEKTGQSFLAWNLAVGGALFFGYLLTDPK